jgi:hypothetical protein
LFTSELVAQFKLTLFLSRIEAENSISWIGSGLAEEDEPKVNGLNDVTLLVVMISPAVLLLELPDPLPSFTH